MTFETFFFFRPIFRIPCLAYERIKFYKFITRGKLHIFLNDIINEIIQIYILVSQIHILVLCFFEQRKVVHKKTCIACEK